MREGETLLFDCGEGTQRQMMRYHISFAVADVFFTHFHADHIIGIIGLMRTWPSRVAPNVSHSGVRAERRACYDAPSSLASTGSAFPWRLRSSRRINHYAER